MPSRASSNVFTSSVSRAGSFAARGTSIKSTSKAFRDREAAGGQSFVARLFTRKRTTAAAAAVTSGANGNGVRPNRVKSALSASGVFTAGDEEVPDDFIQDGIFAPFPTHVTHTTSINQKLRLLRRSKRLGHVLMEVWLGTAKVCEAPFTPLVEA